MAWSTAENRTRIVREVLEALIAVWGPGRVGIKISPPLAMGGFGPTDKMIETYDYLVGRLNGLSLSHLQVGRALNDLSGTPIAALQDTIGYYRARFKGTLIANFGFDGASANTAIESRQADLVSFAKPFISNPDLVRRLRERFLIPGDLLPGRTAGICRLPRRSLIATTSKSRQEPSPRPRLQIAFVIDASSGIGDRRATYFKSSFSFSSVQKHPGSRR